ncbi:carboxymuconolactone decarboxylase family protein [Actinokineospora sp.]|uniref:carboxymuconolactone decarboxylase family protein n=1 Tax=Actinokineospora sp. TaxID=1872133 RepID=UPI0040383C11
MSRVPYPPDAEIDEAAHAVLATLPPLNVVRMFAGAPAALLPLTDLGQAILLRAGLDPKLRQIAILTVARVTESAYERAQHEQLSRMVGLTEDEIRAASAGDLDALDDDSRLVARFAAEITRDVRAGDETTAAVLDRLGRQSTTELVICCAYYCAVARIIATCGVELEAELPTANTTLEDWTPNSTRA